MKLSFLSLATLYGVSVADLSSLASNALQGGSNLINSLTNSAGLIDDNLALAAYKAKYDGVKVAVGAKFSFTDDDIQHVVDVNAQLIDILDAIAEHWPVFKNAQFAMEVNVLSTQAWAELNLIAPRLKGVSCQKINSLISVDSAIDNKYSSIKNANGLELLTLFHTNPFTTIPGCAADQTSGAASGSNPSGASATPTNAASSAPSASGSNNGASSSAPSASGSNNGAPSSAPSASGSNNGASSSAPSASGSNNGASSYAPSASGSNNGASSSAPSASGSGNSASPAAPTASGSTQRCIVRPANGEAFTSFVLF